MTAEGGTALHLRSLAPVAGTGPVTASHAGSALDHRAGSAAAPLRAVQAAWLRRWAVRLDPRHHPSVSGPATVSALLRALPATIRPADEPPTPALDIGRATSPVTLRWLAPHTDAWAATIGGSLQFAAVSMDPMRPIVAGRPVAAAAPFAQAGGYYPAARSLVGPRAMSGRPGQGPSGTRRTAELLIALSSALDAAELRSGGHAVRTAYACLRLAAARGFHDEARAQLLYAGLLRDAGTTGRSVEALGGSESAATGLPGPFARAVARLAGSRPDAQRAPYLSPPDRAAAAIRSLGLPIGVAEAVYAVDERWDGRGPARQHATEIALGARMLAVASAAAAAWAERGRPANHAAGSEGTPVDVPAVERALRSKRGHELDPTLVDAMIDVGRTGLWRELGDDDLAGLLLDLEPSHHVRVSDEDHLDLVCGTFADLVDTRTPRMGRHATRVATLAEQTGSHLGFDLHECRELRRAGLLHDIGKLLVPIEILEKPSELSEHERRVVREHPAAGTAVLRRSRWLEGVVPLIVAHHERLDGEGAFPEYRDPRTALAARVIAVCDRYEAMTSERPYRPLLARDQVWRLLEDACLEPEARLALGALREVVGPD